MKPSKNSNTKEPYRKNSRNDTCSVSFNRDGYSSLKKYLKLHGDNDFPELLVQEEKVELELDNADNKISRDGSDAQDFFSYFTKKDLLEISAQELKSNNILLRSVKATLGKEGSGQNLPKRNPGNLRFLNKKHRKPISDEIMPMSTFFETQSLLSHKERKHLSKVGPSFHRPSQAANPKEINIDFDCLGTKSFKNAGPAMSPAFKRKTSHKNKKIPVFPAGVKHDGCIAESDPSCSQHNCQTCSQSVGDYNALLCQLCENACHIACMAPPLLNLYQNAWLCNKCAPTKTVSSSGLLLYTGNVPGITVGSFWKDRKQLSENQVHSPSATEIHGSGANPAYSVIYQGNYLRDKDDGEEIFYTGVGGRDLNKLHVRDQKLDKANLSLASSCDANLSYEGAKAHDWTKSAPIRVIRESNSSHGSQFMPQGIRYDGIYKLVKYWKEKSPEGFYLWRFHLRRHDIKPPPWTLEGGKYIIEHGILFED